MTTMSFHGRHKGVFGTFHKVTASAAMHVYVYAAGENVVATGIDDLVHAIDVATMIEY